jgi:hypothetical protein
MKDSHACSNQVRVRVGVRVHRLLELDMKDSHACSNQVTVGVRVRVRL